MWRVLIEQVPIEHVPIEQVPIEHVPIEHVQYKVLLSNTKFYFPIQSFTFQYKVFTF
jgi:hypothetical protein